MGAGGLSSSLMSAMDRLDGNQIGNVGARAIAEALKVNMGVTLLG